MQLDTDRIKQDFGRAAAHYTQHADLQWHILGELCRRIAPRLARCQRILDIGCGPGWAREYIGNEATLIGLDLAEPMCHIARSKGMPTLCADACSLPVASGSVDGVLSSLCVQWIDEPSMFLSEAFRILKPGGFLAVATLGPATLLELRESFVACGEAGRVITFQPQNLWEEQAQKAGFRIEAAETIMHPQHYENLAQLLRTLRGIGASNKRRDRKRGMTGKDLLARVEAHYSRHYGLPEGGIHASWQPVFLIGRKD